MRWSALFVSALLVAAARSALADGQQHVRYEQALLGRQLSAADEGYCTQQAGPAAQSCDINNLTPYCKCHIVRAFIQDILRNAEQGFPPDLDLRYVQTTSEKNSILDKLTKWGG